MGIRNDWDVTFPFNRDVAIYRRTMRDGRELRFTITHREVMEAGSLFAVERLKQEKATRLLKEWEQSHEPSHTGHAGP